MNISCVWTADPNWSQHRPRTWCHRPGVGDVQRNIKEAIYIWDYTQCIWQPRKPVVSRYLTTLERDLTITYVTHNIFNTLLDAHGKQNMYLWLGWTDPFFWPFYKENKVPLPTRDLTATWGSSSTAGPLDSSWLLYFHRATAMLNDAIGWWCLASLSSVVFERLLLVFISWSWSRTDLTAFPSVAGQA